MVLFSSLWMLLLLSLTWLAAAQEPDRSLWQDFKPNLPADAVRRVTDLLPLSDQQNRGRWERYIPMWDEFNGKTLDEKRWFPNNPGWKGRQPAFFSPANVLVKDGKLQLTMRKEEPPESLRSEGYHTYSSAAVQSRETVLYGYFEARAKPMRSHGSSAFWFYRSEPERWTEIDVFEIGGGAPGFERKLHMTLHVFHTPTEKKHWSVGGIWEAPFDLADDFHVYGLEWNEKEIKFYFDGVLVRKGTNTHWHQPLTLNFDTETMPDWFGLPRDSDLPSTYLVDYVRAWKARSPASPR
jgi:beta-glucanase (GH16 family)